MNWYKKAKINPRLEFTPNFSLNPLEKEARLADKEPSPDKDIYTVCQYCKRWATEDDNQNLDKVVWKKYHELKEDSEMPRADAAMGGSSDKGSISLSHGICDYCMDIINEKIEKGKKKNDPNMFNFDHDEIRQRSLEMS
jgi:hypothetical protein